MYKRLSIFIFLLVTPLVSYGSNFSISKMTNTNQLIWNDGFRAHVKDFFGHAKGEYFWKGPLSEQVLSGLGGPPDDIKKIDDNTYLATACRAHSCPEKAAYVVQKDLELFAIISYKCPSEDEYANYNDKGCLIIFFKNDKAKDSLSNYLLSWQKEYNSSMASYFIKLN